MMGIKDFQKLREFGMDADDLEYLDESFRGVLFREIGLEKPDRRIIDIIKSFVSILRYMEIWMCSYKAYTVTTNTLVHLWQRIENLPSNTEEYSLLKSIFDLDSMIRVWMANFFTLEHRMVILLRQRQIGACEKILEKIKMEMPDGKRLFVEFDNHLKQYKSLLFTEKKAEQGLFYIE